MICRATACGGSTSVALRPPARMNRRPKSNSNFQYILVCTRGGRGSRREQWQQACAVAGGVRGAAVSDDQRQQWRIRLDSLGWIIIGGLREGEQCAHEGGIIYARLI